MQKFLGTLIVVIALSQSKALYAGADVWLNFVDGSSSAGGNITVTQNGSPGDELFFSLPNIGTATFTVEMLANITPDGGNLASTSTTLVTSSSKIRVSDTTTNLAGPGTGAGANIVEPGFAPGNLLSHFGQGNFFVGIPPADGFLIGTITFEIDTSLGISGETIAIDGVIGANTWALLSGFGVDPVTFGSGSGTNGANIGTFGGRLATITFGGIPEPATVSLLGLCALGSTRRRR